MLTIITVQEEEQALLSTCTTPYGTLNSVVSHPLDALCYLLATSFTTDEEEDNKDNKS